ncbi:MAG: hypothetical protein RQ899_01440 [Pseudomonadales bacterium]|nr:hypothetical protein [Pseudomonadales bacterium]
MLGTENAMPASPAVATNESTQNTGKERLPEEITVIGEIPVDVLRDMVSAAEDHMYAVFNELNDDEGNFYDIHCRMEASTGALIRQKICRPAYQDEADYQETQGIFGGQPYINSVSMKAFYTRRLREKFGRLMQESPEFNKAIREFVALNQALDERQSTRLGGRKDELRSQPGMD